MISFWCLMSLRVASVFWSGGCIKVGPKTIPRFSAFIRLSFSYVVTLMNKQTKNNLKIPLHFHSLLVITHFWRGSLWCLFRHVSMWHNVLQYSEITYDSWLWLWLLWKKRFNGKIALRARGHTSLAKTGMDAGHVPFTDSQAECTVLK